MELLPVAELLSAPRLNGERKGLYLFEFRGVRALPDVELPNPVVKLRARIRPLVSEGRPEAFEFGFGK